MRNFGVRATGEHFSLGANWLVFPPKMEGETMSRTSMCFGLLAVFAAMTAASPQAVAQQQQKTLPLASIPVR